MSILSRGRRFFHLLAHVPCNRFCDIDSESYYGFDCARRSRIWSRFIFAVYSAPGLAITQILVETLTVALLPGLYSNFQHFGASRKRAKSLPMH